MSENNKSFYPRDINFEFIHYPKYGCYDHYGLMPTKFNKPFLFFDFFFVNSGGLFLSQVSMNKHLIDYGPKKV